MSKYLHLKVAKRLCREQWAWYVDNLYMPKGLWPKMKEILVEYEDISSDCFFCHYTHAKGEAPCRKRCPFYLKYGHQCMEGPHPYHTDPIGFNAMIQAIK